MWMDVGIFQRLTDIPHVRLTASARLDVDP
jgi:hypothetical protein